MANDIRMYQFHAYTKQNYVRLIARAILLCGSFTGMG